MASYFKSRNKRQDKRERELRRLERLRKLKADKHQRLADAGLLEREPKMERWYRFELGVRDKITGETCFVDLKSARDARERINAVLKYYKPDEPALRQGQRSARLTA